MFVIEDEIHFMAISASGVKWTKDAIQDFPHEIQGTP